LFYDEEFKDGKNLLLYLLSSPYRIGNGLEKKMMRRRKRRKK
jgi:hypothetical protein